MSVLVGSVIFIGLKIAVIRFVGDIFLGVGVRELRSGQETLEISPDPLPPSNLPTGSPVPRYYRNQKLRDGGILVRDVAVWKMEKLET